MISLVHAPQAQPPHCAWESQLHATWKALPVIQQIVCVPLGPGCLRNTSSFPSEMQNSWIGWPKTVYHEIPLDSQSAVCPGYRWHGMRVNPWGRRPICPCVFASRIEGHPLQHLFKNLSLSLSPLWIFSLSFHCAVQFWPGSMNIDFMLAFLIELQGSRLSHWSFLPAVLLPWQPTE